MLLINSIKEVKQAYKAGWGGLVNLFEIYCLLSLPSLKFIFLQYTLNHTHIQIWLNKSKNSATISLTKSAPFLLHVYSFVYNLMVVLLIVENNWNHVMDHLLQIKRCI